MATQAAPAAVPPAAIWEDFIDIFYAPSAVFRRRENGNFFIPLAVITIVCGVLFYLNSGALQPMFDAEFDRGMAQARRQNPNIPPEAMANMRAFASRIQMVAIFIFIPIAIFGVGVITWVAGKLVDAKQTFKAALVVGAYAYAPRILDGVLQGVQALFLDPANINGRFKLSLGVGRFFDPDTTSPLLLAVVGRVDLITIWITVLVAIGLCVTGRIPLGKAAIAAVIVWLVGGLPLIIPALQSM
jgi:Yip1 domain